MRLYTVLLCLSPSALIACSSAPPVPPVPPDACPAWAGDTSSPASSQIAIVFKNEMSAMFGLRRVLVGLDGRAICWLNGPPGDQPFIEARGVPIFSGPVREGEHQLQLLLHLEGRSDTELSTYRFEVRSGHFFRLEQGRPLDVAVIAYEKDPTIRPPWERPAIRFTESPPPRTTNGGADTVPAAFEFRRERQAASTP